MLANILNHSLSLSLSLSLSYLSPSREPGNEKKRVFLLRILSNTLNKTLTINLVNTFHLENYKCYDDNVNCCPKISLRGYVFKICKHPVIAEIVTSSIKLSRMMVQILTYLHHIFVNDIDFFH
jgi:hypothetical protein